MKVELTPIIHFFFPNCTDFKAKMYGNGHINSTYLLQIKEAEQPEKTFILQKLNIVVFTSPEKIAQNTLEITRFLAKNAYNYQISTPVFSPQNECYFVENNNYWRVFTFLPTTYAPEKCESVEQAYLSGKAFGHFFKVLSGLETKRLNTIIPRFHDATFRWQQFSDAMQNATKSRKQEAKTEIEFCLKMEHLVQQYAEVIDTLPQRITHNDTKITNILFDQKTHQPVAIIDLDTVQSGTILSEFGDMVRTFCNSAAEDERSAGNIKFRENIYEALKKGFLSETAEILTKNEIDLLPFAAKLTIFVQGLRFLSDFLNNDTYYKTKYANHNLIRAKNQFVLLKYLLK